MNKLKQEKRYSVADFEVDEIYLRALSAILYGKVPTIMIWQQTGFIDILNGRWAK